MTVKDRFPLPKSFWRSVVEASKAAIQAFSTSLYTADVAITDQAADHAAQTVKLRVVGSQETYQAEDAEMNAPTLLLEPVPYLMSPWLEGPIGNAQPGIVVYARRSIDEYIAEGQTDYNPGEPRAFSCDDGVFIPGTLRGGTEATNIVLAFVDTASLARLILKPSGAVDLGNGTEDIVTLLNDWILFMRNTWVDSNTDTASVATQGAIDTFLLRVAAIKP